MDTFSKRLLKYLEEVSIRSVWDSIGRREGNVADLSLGNPSGFSSPVSLFDGLKILLESRPKGLFLYMDNAGHLETRKAVAKDLISSKFFSKQLNENHIIMTAGASGAVNCVLSSLLNPLDEVIVLSPFFVDYPKYVENFSSVPKIVSLEAPSFDLNIDLIEKSITKKTKAIIVNSPNNPTGKIYSKEKLDELSKLLLKKGVEIGHPIYLISDEVYREIVYDGVKFYSPCTDYKYSIMVYSFSKSLSIPGERIGYVAINPLMEDAEKLFKLIKLSNRTLGFTNAPSLIQQVIISLLPLKFDNEFYQKQRDKLALVLKKSGFEFHLPEGAFYFFVKLPFKNFVEIAGRNGLAVVNSDPFGVSGYFRMAFCVPQRTIDLACSKLEDLGKLIRA